MIGKLIERSVMATSVQMNVMETSWYRRVRWRQVDRQADREECDRDKLMQMNVMDTS